MRVSFKPAGGSDLSDRQVGFREKARETVHAATVNFLHGCAAKVSVESVRQRASRESGGCREIRDAKISVAVLAYETQGPD